MHQLRQEATPRNIDKIITDTEAEEIAAVEKGEGGRTLAFARRIESRMFRKAKAELVEGNDLPSTPDTPPPLPPKTPKE